MPEVNPNWQIRRGENITQQQIEAELGYRREEDPQGYFSDLMRMTRECHAILKARGEQATIRNCDHGIQILNSGAAMEHQVKRGRNARARMIDSFHQLQDTVELGELSQDGRRAYEDALRVEGAYVHAIQRVRRQLRSTGNLTNEVPRDPQPEVKRRRL
jgi:hypothetical protein